MLSKIVLWMAAIGFTPYGFMCLIDPSTATDYAGLSMTNGDAFVEISAMYGGLQVGLGLLCLLGALKPRFTHTSLTAVAFVIGGLVIGRSVGFFVGSDPVTSYTYGALVFEWLLTTLSILALRQSRPQDSSC